MTFSVNENILLKCLRKYVCENGDGDAEIRITSNKQTNYVVPDGCNYCSVITKVRVEYEIYGEPHSKTFMVKIPFGSVNYEMISNAGSYAKETYMYEKIIPRIMELLNFSMAPIHYHTIDSEILIFDDLTELGFRAQHKGILNFEQSSLVLETLAKFHAASYRLHLESPELLREASHETFFTIEFVNFIVNVSYPVLVPLLKIEGVSPLGIQKFLSYKDEIFGKSIFHVSKGAFEFCTLNHGDLKTDNILFKYNENGEIIDVKFVDFQACRWSSPIIDIFFYATYSMRFDTFENHFDELVESYLRKLNDALEMMDCRLSYTRQQFDNDLESSKLFCVYTWILLAFVVGVKGSLNEFDIGKTMILDSNEIEKIRVNGNFRRYIRLFNIFVKKGIF